MTPRATGLALLGCGCAPFGPNLTGRWSGRCASEPPADIVLELAELDADIEGAATLTFPPEAEAEAQVEDRLAYADISGSRDGRDVRLEWVLSSSLGGLLEHEAEVRGNRLEGELAPAYYGWPRPDCTLDLER